MLTTAMEFQLPTVKRTMMMVLRLWILITLTWIVSITYGKANATWKQLMAIGINAEFQLPTVKRTRGAVAPRKYETSVSITYGKANTFFNSQCALL